jgi:4-hydroxy-tetrahydrodipicolinate synthase
LSEAIQASDPSIVWVGGLAEIWAPAFYAVGARGFTSGLINVWPERSVAINAALENGDFGDANALIRGMSAFEALRADERTGANVSIVKAALKFLGQDCGRPRVPAAWPLTAEADRRLSVLLSEWPVLQPLAHASL